MTGDEYLTDLDWFKASASSGTGGCLEVAFLPDGRVALRDNEDLTKLPHVVSRHVWACFLDGAANGEFNPPSTD
ncbi:DUF397 domain-containing protein (plasmid) [Streptomyces europaeiscabiei]|uniref:DUF397 domain-containing protein n=1 Tax=Streptomyces europaeiscabiei TaxID=146819 RepID=UPI002E819880|nr:DUF397 domain-containing protein [Streptomyces europaeiscabiei]WUD38810.1 DUF397 domain-containing protein [Streptomyces europaeiscabiei]